MPHDFSFGVANVMPSLNQKNRAPDLPLLIKKSSGDLDSPSGVTTSPLGIDDLAVLCSATIGSTKASSTQQMKPAK